MYYKLDSTRLTLREYAQSASIVMLPLLMLLKLFRVRLGESGAVPDSIEPFRADIEDVPEDVRAKIEPLEEEMRSCGFVDPAYHWIWDPYSARRVCVATYRHQSGTVLGQITFARMGPRNPPKETIGASFISAFRDGTYFVSTNKRPELIGPPVYKVQRFVGASIPDLWREHIQQTPLETFGKISVPVYSREQMLAVVEKEEADNIAFQVERGVLVPHGEAEQKTIETVMTAPGTEIDRSFAAIYDEINRLVNKKASWGNAILILIITVIVFISVKDKGQSWESLVLVSGVLLIHELGHLAAMWLFRYRNLRMFFIPFFGAAVSGQNYNVPGWKKAIVSLMGPLPGIVLGGVVGVLAVIYQTQMLWMASFMLLGLNMLNLLPVMPMDGGQVCHAVLFSRHPIIDVIFRAAAALLLIASGLAGMRGLAVLGVFMLIALPTVYRVGKVVHRLRRSGFKADSPDSQTVPIETARTIYEELRHVIPANSNAKNSAQMTLNAFESLNAKPPGWLASLALMGVHGCGFLGAGVIILVLVAVQHGGLKNLLLSRMKQQPKHDVQAAAMQNWEGADVKKADRAKVNTIVATCSNAKEAERTYRKIIAELPARATATLFGQTVLVTLPAEDEGARERWFNELNRQGKNVFVQRGERPVNFDLSCTVPDAKTAERLAEEAKMYLQMPAAMHAIPPWSPEHKHKLTEHDLKARKTFAAIRFNTTLLEDPRWSSFNDKILDTEDEKEIAKLEKERDQLEREIEKALFQRLRNEGEEKWDITLIDRYEKAPEPTFAGISDANDPKASLAFEQHEKEVKRWSVEFGSHLGQLPMDGDVPAAGAERFSAPCGTALSNDRTLHFEISLMQPSFGAPALVKWLSEHGCVKMKYEFVSSMEDDED